MTEISEVTAAIADDAAQDKPLEMHGPADFAAVNSAATVPPAPAEAPKEDSDAYALNWPQIIARDGAIYSFTDPVWGNRMVGMTLDTFLSIREDINKLKTALTAAQYENIQLFQELQRRPPAPEPEKKEEPRILTPATGMLPLGRKN